MFFVFFAVTTISRKTLNNSNHISSSTFQFTLSKLLIGRIKEAPKINILAKKMNQSMKTKIIMDPNNLMSTNRLKVRIT